MDLTGVPTEYLSELGRHQQLKELILQNSTLDVTEITEQLTRLENKMADIEAVLESFRAAVDKELLDDQAQNDLIALLQGQVTDADALVQAARDGETAAKAQVDALLVELEAATERLSENDIPDAPTDPGTGEPVEPEVPEEPTEPTPEEPVEETPVEPTPEEPTEPVEEPVEETPAESEVPAEEDQPEGPTPTPDNPFAI